MPNSNNFNTVVCIHNGIEHAVNANTNSVLIRPTKLPTSAGPWLLL